MSLRRSDLHARPVYLSDIIEGDAAEELLRLPPDSVHLTVTSPPYRNARLYDGRPCNLRRIIEQLYRVTVPCGVVVWIVADTHGDVNSANPGESDDAFDQARLFRRAGFVRHDTMFAVWPNKMPRQKYRYEQVSDYMFIFCKGPRPRVANIRRVPCANAGKRVLVRKGHHSDQVGAYRDRSGPRKAVVVNPDKPEGNVLHYATGLMQTTGDKVAWDHPSPFPELLASDHIDSWSREGDVVLDPMCGSGTTPKMALLGGRRWLGIEVCPEYVDIARKRLAIYLPPVPVSLDLEPVPAERLQLESVPPPPPKVRAARQKTAWPDFVWVAGEPVVSIDEFAKLSDRSHAAVRMLAKRNRLPSIKQGTKTMIPARAVALLRAPLKVPSGSLRKKRGG